MAKKDDEDYYIISPMTKKGDEYYVSLNDLLKKVMYSKLKLTSNSVFKR